MALPLVPLFVGAVGAAVARIADFFLTNVVAEKAFHYALITGFLITATSLFLGLTIAMKALILGARVAMPQSLGMVTYFLPPSTGQLFATIVILRVSVMLYRWSVSVFQAYLPTDPKFGLMLGR